MSSVSLHSLPLLLGALAVLSPQVSFAQEETEAASEETSAPEAAPEVTTQVAEPAAEPVAEPVQPTNKMNFEVAPPDRALERTDYAHHGFYFRVNAGGGFLYSNINNKAASASSDGSSFSLGLDALVGGTVAPGMALGFAALTNTAVSVPVFNQNITQFHFIAGPFFDAFPNSRKGGHVGAAIGFAGTTLDSIGGGSAFGGGGAIWAGYDAWVAPDWSVGFFLRGTGAYMAGSDVESAAVGLQAMITLLHN